MGNAKDIILKPITAKEANALVKRIHYSGKVVNNSTIHIGAFYRGRLEGAMQFGPSLDKRKLQGLVKNTLWNEFIELNRMAFSDVLPRNSESRALAIAFKILRKHAPQLKWVVSFADATQCGDGTIYRAAGFVLTGISKRGEMIKLPNGEVVHRVALNTNGNLVANSGGAMMGAARRAAQLGGQRLDGYQLRYVYFLDPTYRDRLSVPIIPFSQIDDIGARMYKGTRLNHANEATEGAPGVQPGKGGASPTRSLINQDDTP